MLGAERHRWGGGASGGATAPARCGQRGKEADREKEGCIQLRQIPLMGTAISPKKGWGKAVCRRGAVAPSPAPGSLQI